MQEFRAATTRSEMDDSICALGPDSTSFYVVWYRILSICDQRSHPGYCRNAGDRHDVGDVCYTGFLSTAKHVALVLLDQLRQSYKRYY